MDDPRQPGFSRRDLQARYDVSHVTEDKWHKHSDRVTHAAIAKHLPKATGKWLLNAGAGPTMLPQTGSLEVAIDLFEKPLAGRPYAVCATVTQLPFRDGTFGAVVCVGEVLAYCDPSSAISEFSRVMHSGATLIVDFGSTASWRHLGRPSFERSAALLVSEYNGFEERTWIFHPTYILDRLQKAGFRVGSVYGAHYWSTLARRVGLGVDSALFFERRLGRTIRSWQRSDTITVVAEKVTA